MSRESWGALEADLLRAGYTMADYPKRLDLRAVIAFWRYAVPGSAVFRVEHGAKGEWQYTQELLALILETLRDANWQRQGISTAPRPQKLPRPGQEVEGVRHFGDEPMTIAEFNKRWAAA